MSKQVRIRRDTNANLMAAVPADGELAYDTDNDRLSAGNGVTQGGVPHANFRDVQQNNFRAAVAAGTADALTITLSPAPAALTEFTEVRFRAAAANTASGPTLNVNGLGVKTLKKQQGGAKVDLAAGDLFAGGEYGAVYDGTYWIITNAPVASGLTSVSQGNLNTSTGAVGRNDSGALPNTTMYTLPGGSYGFYPQFSLSSATGIWSAHFIDNITGSSIGTGYASRITLACNSSGSGSTFYAQQRYITSSPPFDLGDGEVGGFLFGLVDQAGDLAATYMADVPPWAYNGPTDIRAVKIDPKTGKKYRAAKEKLTLEQIMAGVTPQTVFEEITQELKQADMPLIPHPFGVVPEGFMPVLFDPMDARLRNMIDLQNAGGGNDIIAALTAGQIFCDNTALPRGGPPGVHIGRLRYKNSRR